MFTRWFGSGVSDGTCECKKIKQNFFHKGGLECPHHFMILHDTTEPAIIEWQSTILRSPPPPTKLVGQKAQGDQISCVQKVQLR